MNPAEQTAIVRASLRSLEKRAGESELLCDMLRGQLRRQQTELATAMGVVAGAAIPDKRPAPSTQPLMVASDT